MLCKWHQRLGSTSGRAETKASMATRALTCAAVLAHLLARADAKPPHIFFLLADDLGSANVGFALPAPSREVQTPNLDALAASGAVLTRAYVHKFCSPTRTAIQTGRAPIHVNVLNSDIMQHNSSDLVGGFQGAPRNITGLATKLKSAGYATHLVGKWHAGAATPDHTPQGRG